LGPTVTSGIRLGTPAVTTRGMTENDMVQIAESISLCLIKDNMEESAQIVERLTEKYPMSHLQ
jgi:glycine hydroxymethyltransferase